MYDGERGTLEPISDDRKAELEQSGRLDQVAVRRLFTVGEIVSVKGGSFRIVKFLSRNRMMLKAVKSE